MNRYLTTPIYYASGSPHLGHAYTTFVADCYRRYHALCGDDVLLATGTDEHGQKIERTAAAAGVSPAQFVNDRSLEFRALWEDLDIAVDRFERTTDDSHVRGVLDFWQRLKDNGDLYKGRYEGLYCVACEQYFTSGDECPVHHQPLERFEEESWFFRLSRYQDRLIAHLESNPAFIVPAARYQEVLSFLTRNQLHDLAVSRAATHWGIPVPGDEAHVIYVWVDALCTYLTALDDPARWGQTTHFIGKDILIFHAVYWPALLWSAGYEAPRNLVVNGWLTVSGRKIAKSDPATIVNPAEIAGQVGTEGLKYYFASAVSLGSDADFDGDRLVEVLNADLANGLGNLVSRYATLFCRHFPDGVSAPPTEDQLLVSVRAQVEQVFDLLNRYELHAAARTFAAVVRQLNADFQQREPWKIESREDLAGYFWCLHHCLSALSLVALCLAPNLGAALRDRLGLQSSPSLAELSQTGVCVSVKEGQGLYARLATT